MRLILMDVTDEQVGLLLLALQDMLTDNRIGGYGRDGYGRLRVDAVTLLVMATQSRSTMIFMMVSPSNSVTHSAHIRRQRWTRWPLTKRTL